MGWPSTNDGSLSPEDIWMQIPVLLHVSCTSPHGLKFPKGLAIVNVPSLEQSPRDPLRGYDFRKMLNTVLLKIRSLWIVPSLVPKFEALHMLEIPQILALTSLAVKRSTEPAEAEITRLAQKLCPANLLSPVPKVTISAEARCQSAWVEEALESFPGRRQCFCKVRVGVCPPLTPAPSELTRRCKHCCPLHLPVGPRSLHRLFAHTGFYTDVCFHGARVNIILKP